MKVVLYSKQGCMGCLASEIDLEDKLIPYEEVMIDEDKEAKELVQKKGFLQAPVVMVYDDEGSVVDSWSGFRPDRISALKKFFTDY
jgi:glutaredoxin-like protein NrdH